VYIPLIHKTHKARLHTTIATAWMPPTPLQTPIWKFQFAGSSEFQQS